MTNPNYEILEQIYRLDQEAAVATTDWRVAQKELTELAKKSKESEEVIGKSRSEMNFLESELRRQYKKADELDERKSDRSGKLFSAKTDDDHRALKREVDNLERDVKETVRRAEETETRIEQLKSILISAEQSLQTSLAATSEERKKAESAEKASSQKLSEIGSVRETHLKRLEDRLCQHYQRVAKLTKNINGPVTKIRNNSCGNCHITLSPLLMNRVKSGKEIEFCHSCTHILLP